MTTTGPATDIPPGTALLLVDFQDWIIERYVSVTGPAAVECAENLHRSFRDRGRLVVHVRHQAQDAPPPTLGLRRDISDRVAVEADEWVITKTTISAFGVPALHDMLQEALIATIVLAGVVTEAAVKQTALDAITRGYHVVIPVESVASSTPAIKNDTLGALATAGAEIRLTAPRAGS